MCQWYWGIAREWPQTWPRMCLNALYWVGRSLYLNLSLVSLSVESGVVCILLAPSWEGSSDQLEAVSGSCDCPSKLAMIRGQFYIHSMKE